MNTIVDDGKLVKDLKTSVEQAFSSGDIGKLHRKAKLALNILGGELLQKHHDVSAAVNQGNVFTHGKHGVKRNGVALIIRIRRQRDKARRMAHKINAGENVFTKQGDTWLIQYKGNMKVFPDEKGFRFIHYLLSNKGPHTPIEILNKLYPVKVHPGDMQRAKRIGSLDENSELREDGNMYSRQVEMDDNEMDNHQLDKSEVKGALCELQEELDLARQQGNSREVKRIEGIYRNLGIVTTKYSKAGNICVNKRHGNKEAEQARDVVRKRISAAIKAIKKYNADLASHFVTSLTTRKFKYTYGPLKPVKWNA